MYKFNIIKHYSSVAFFPMNVSLPLSLSGLHETVIYRESQCNCKAFSLVQFLSTFHVTGFINTCELGYV